MFGNHYYKHPLAWAVGSFLLSPPSMDHYFPMAPSSLHGPRGRSLYPCLVPRKGQGALSAFSSWGVSTFPASSKAGNGERQHQESTPPQWRSYSLAREWGRLCSCWRDRHWRSSALDLSRFLNGKLSSGTTGSQDLPYIGKTPDRSVAWKPPGDTKMPKVNQFRGLSRLVGKLSPALTVSKSYA